MATIVLSSLGAAAGGALLPSGLSVLGATLSGAAIGQALGATAGSYIDQALFGASGQPQRVEGARLSDLQITASSEGAPIPHVYGRVRLAGQLIWATRFEEEIITTTQSSGGGKGLGGAGGGGGTTVKRTEYRYYANFAIGLCAGEITRIGRIWADGKELDLSGITYRVYRGTETQLPDSLIEAKQGAGLAPAYRGLAYVVFERLPLARFGNRLPQLNFEIFRAVDGFENTVRAVTMIPGAGEFVYEKDRITRDGGGGVTISENVHNSSGQSDWDLAIDQLQDALPNCGAVSLIVSWFGTDLRANQCRIEPRVEISNKQTAPDSWAVAGLSRSTANTVSLHDGNPAFGGTPSDRSVISAIQDLKARGLKVVFNPFILMDIPAGNSLTDPYTGIVGQPVYPWRGRITIDPAPGVSGSPDQTAAAATQIAAFVGAAQRSDFTINGENVIYNGPAEWSYRRMILHYAHLCAAAGGVDGFLIGTELRGLTWVRDSASSYPFVSALISLAADVKAILGASTKVTYAADWSEYFGHQPQDGSGDVYFHLDPLWSSPDIDAVGIDLYWPLADWRDGDTHLDRLNGTLSTYDLDYLKGNITGGEGFDWYYASRSDRDAQLRTPITDGLGKPWVFRFKDIKSWWENQHFNRPGGVEESVPTSWVPQSKPFWFTETGCPAVDKGANQPNVFHDAKSSESRFPYYSRGVRDDLMQRRYLQAIYEHFDRSHPAYQAGSNPLSSVYGAPMVDLDRIFAYTWDARPFPAFPNDQTTWADAGNWSYGHWLTGRTASGPLSAVVSSIMGDAGFTKFSADSLTGNMDGYVIDRIMSVREALQPLELAFFFDSIETGGRIQFLHRGRGGVAVSVDTEELVEVKADEPRYQLTRGQETDLPQSAKISYIDGTADYRQAAVESRRLVGRSHRVATASLPIVMAQDQAQAMADSWLQDAWAARDKAQLALPPSKLGVEPGDLIKLTTANRSHLLRVTQITDGEARALEALSIAPSIFDAVQTPLRDGTAPVPSVFGPALAYFLDLPLLRGDETPHAAYVAAFQSPWPGAVAFYRSPEATGFELNTEVTGQATLGVTTTDLQPGPTGRIDFGNRLTVSLSNGSLASVTRLAMLGGANVAAIENSNGEWEVIQFQNAQLVAPNSYELSYLLRGQGGTEGFMQAPIAAGARFLLLDQAVTQLDMTIDEVGLAFNWKYGPGNLPIDDPAYRDRTFTGSGLGLKPLSPVHVKAARDPATGDVNLSWIRRTRIGGDSWESPEVPLGEESEAYEVEVMDGTIVKRVLSSSVPFVTYSAADQLADWGGLQASYLVKIYQIAPSYGRGHPQVTTIFV